MLYKRNRDGRKLIITGALTSADGPLVAVDQDGGRVVLDREELYWLVVIAGPAVLAELAQGGE